MATKKDNLPLTLDQDNDSTGTITYANEVIAIIAGVAANEVEGVAGMCSGGGITEKFGRNKNITKGVKVELGTEEAAVDIYLIVEYGTPIQTCAAAVQENVRKSIESMTGLHVVRVDVHVQGVSFEKEQTAISFENLPGLNKADEPAPKAPEKPVEPPKPVHVEFEGEPTPAEEHEPTPVDIEMEQEKAAAEAAADEEPSENE